VRKLLHLVAITGIVAVLWGCAPSDKTCTTTEVRTSRPDGGYDIHYTKVCEPPK
jgi:hypothetical protein